MDLLLNPVAKGYEPGSDEKKIEFFANAYDATFGIGMYGLGSLHDPVQTREMAFQVSKLVTELQARDSIKIRKPTLTPESYSLFQKIKACRPKDTGKRGRKSAFEAREICSLLNVVGANVQAYVI